MPEMDEGVQPTASCRAAGQQGGQAALCCLLSYNAPVPMSAQFTTFWIKGSICGDRKSSGGLDQRMVGKVSGGKQFAAGNSKKGTSRQGRSWRQAQTRVDKVQWSPVAEQVQA